MPALIFAETSLLTLESIPLQSYDVTDFEDATVLLAQLLGELGYDFCAYQEIMEMWEETRMADRCACGRPECGNVILSLGIDVEMCLGLTVGYYAQA